MKPVKPAAEESEPRVPADLQKTLEANPKAKAEFFQKLRDGEFE